MENPHAPKGPEHIEYQALSREELIALIESGSSIPQIGTQIIRAIPGITSPNPTEGPVAEKIDEVYRILNEKRENLKDPETIDEIMSVIS